MGAMTAVEASEVGTFEPMPLSLQLNEGTTFEEWVNVGRKLCHGQQALQWHIGDWWAFGDHRYGDRAKAAAEGIFGRSFKTLANVASVTRSFETSRRREVLSFTHHAEVAALPPEKREELLDRAEEEGLSATALRREVAALKAPPAADAEDDTERRLPRSHPDFELVEACEAIIELGTALEDVRPLTGREKRVLRNARMFVDEAHRGRRPVPDDFDIIFVEKGRLECETWYRASRISVNRWLVLRGKQRLIDLRAAFLKSQGTMTKPEPADAAPAIVDDPELLPLARRAADFLRTSRYGGWMITKDAAGGWRVGTVRRSADEMIAMAERQGFDRKQVMLELRAADGQ